jgi:hypothetical protein
VSSRPDFIDQGHECGKRGTPLNSLVSEFGLLSHKVTVLGAWEQNLPTESTAGVSKCRIIHGVINNISLVLLFITFSSEVL